MRLAAPQHNMMSEHKRLYYRPYGLAHNNTSNSSNTGDSYKIHYTVLNININGSKITN